MSNLIDIPALGRTPPVKDEELRRFLDGLKRAVMVQQTNAAAISRLALSGGGTSTTTNIIQQPGGGFTPPAQDLTPPPAPTGLAAQGALFNIILTWDAPTYANHGHTEVWSSATNNLGTAIRIGTTVANVYADPVGFTGATRYYWIRFVKIVYQLDGTYVSIVGPYNGTAGTSGGTGLIGNVDLGPLIVTAGKIADSGVTAVKLYDSDFSTLGEDLGFELGGGTWIAETGWSVQNDATNARTGAWVARHAGSAGTQNAVLQNAQRFYSRPGDKYYVEAWFKGAAAAGAGRIGVRFYNTAGTAISTVSFQSMPTATYAVAGGVATAPAATAYARLVILAETNTSGTIYVDDCLARLVIGSLLVDDAAITQAKIAALAVGSAAIQYGAIVNALIANAAVDDAKIANLSAAKITTGFLDVARLQANTITVDKLNVALLSGITTSTGTLTIGAGGFLRLGATDYRTGNGFWVGDKAGTPKLSLGQQGGSGLTWDGAALTVYDALGRTLLSAGGVQPNVLEGAAGYYEAFTGVDPIAGLNVFGGLASQLSVVTGAPGDAAAGGKLLRCDGYVAFVGRQRLPFNGNYLYRCRARIFANSAKPFYIGWAGYDASGVLCNFSGANSLGGQHYIIASGAASNGLYTTFEGYVRGRGPTGLPTPGAIASPSVVHTNVVSIAPIAYVNYPDGVIGTHVSWIDFISWDVVNAGPFGEIGQITPSNIGAFLAPNSIGTTYIADLAVTAAKIGFLAVNSAHIADLSVDNAKIANLSVSTIKLVNEAVTTQKLIVDAVTDRASIYDQTDSIILGNPFGTVSVDVASVTINVGATGDLHVSGNVYVESSGVTVKSGTAVSVLVDGVEHWAHVLPAYYIPDGFIEGGGGD